MVLLRAKNLCIYFQIIWYIHHPTSWSSYCVLHMQNGGQHKLWFVLKVRGPGRGWIKSSMDSTGEGNIQTSTKHDCIHSHRNGERPSKCYCINHQWLGYLVSVLFFLHIQRVWIFTWNHQHAFFMLSKLHNLFFDEFMYLISGTIVSVVRQKKMFLWSPSALG